MAQLHKKNVKLLRRHIFEQGAGKILVVEPITVVPEARDTSGTLPGVVRGKIWRIDKTPFTLRSRFGSRLSDAAPIFPLLQEWFAAYRHEPASTYNQHRLYASVRSKYPVNIFVETTSQTWHIDSNERIATVVAKRVVADPEDTCLRIHLAGCWTHLPDYYRLLRGALVDVELGINLRHLLTALAVGGYREVSVLSDPSKDEALLHRIGVRQASQWARPLTVVVQHGPLGLLPTDRMARQTVSPTWDSNDQTLDTIRILDRDRTGDLSTIGVWSTSLALIGENLLGQSTWLDVLMARTSGRMPLGLTGIKGRRRVIGAEALKAIFEWTLTESPQLLERHRGRLRITAALRGVEGHADGIYSVDRSAPRLIREDIKVMDKLESIYGYPTAPNNGCAVGKANLVLFFSTDVVAAAEQIGSEGWGSLQILSGWMTHGACIGAAQHRLYARPVRAFDETAAKEILELPDKEVPILGVIIGAEGYRGLLMDVTVP
ncbi:hypothetical protein [Rathayibacter toxicus]|uniref:hypothetical protein n=1 Tax=Rathayibacter toxicus TaxID=145458 RepID=UPI001C0553CA|nr:hypothetical protein [Rathayibacter toxicus]QWL30898.1 hypothetical protein E2R34_09200 [Rathayibacter toxicus]